METGGLKLIASLYLALGWDIFPVDIIYWFWSHLFKQNWHWFFVLVYNEAYTKEVYNEAYTKEVYNEVYTKECIVLY